MSWFSNLFDNLFKRKPPAPPAPPPVRWATLGIWAKDNLTGKPIEGALVDVYDPAFPAPIDGRTNEDGYFPIQVKQRTYTVEVHAPGYLSLEKDVAVLGNHDEIFELMSSRPVWDANQEGALTSQGPVFLNHGEPHRWLGCTAFMLPLRHADGEDVDDFLDWAVMTGFNVLRCFFGMYYVPQQIQKMPRLLTPAQTKAFLEKAASRHVRVEWTVGDLQMLITDDDPTKRLAKVRDWYDGQINVLKDFTELVTAETVNEWFKNGVDPKFIGRFGYGILQTSGNYGPPCEPRLDYGTTHTPRDEEWPRKGKELYDLYNGFDPDLPGGVRIPWVSDEPMGADETSKGNRSNVPNDFFDDAAVCALMGAGGTFHCQDGIYGRVPGPVQQQCGDAYVAGSRSVPLDAALGQYTRGGLADSPLEHDDNLALRTFARLQGDRATAVVVRPTAAWKAVPRNGWQIISVAGPDDRVIHLAR